MFKTLCDATIQNFTLNLFFEPKSHVSILPIALVDARTNEKRLRFIAQLKTSHIALVILEQTYVLK